MLSKIMMITAVLAFTFFLANQSVAGAPSTNIQFKPGKTAPSSNPVFQRPSKQSIGGVFTPQIKANGNMGKTTIILKSGAKKASF